MRMNPVVFDGGQPPIDGYAPGGFRIGGAFIDGAVLIGPSGTTSWDADDALTGDQAATQLIAAATDCDFIVLGLGRDMRATPEALGRRLESAGLAVEALATPGACRTYNVLLAEGRRVLAALLPV